MVFYGDIYVTKVLYSKPASESVLPENRSTVRPVRDQIRYSHVNFHPIAMRAASCYRYSTGCQYVPFTRAPDYCHSIGYCVFFFLESTEG
jgi:hypothetical protein